MDSRARSEMAGRSDDDDDTCYSLRSEMAERADVDERSELASMLPSSHALPSASQGRFGGGLLRGFLDAVEPAGPELAGREESDAPTAGWKPSPADWRALNFAASVLETAEPVFGGPPHVSWFGQYGCVLLADMPHVATVQLRLLCLDGWTFWEHSHTGGRTHTSQPAPDSARQLPVGQIELEECDSSGLSGACRPAPARTHWPAAPLPY